MPDITGIVVPGYTGVNPVRDSNAENKSNKTNVINENSQPSQYPSAPAVYRVVQPKADKVNGATAGNLAGLDANGNLTDSGVDPSTLAPLDNPVFTGTPQVPTAEAGTDTKQAASTAFVQAAVAPVASSASKAKDYALGAYVTPTASGAIANFDDGAEDIPVKSLVVDIGPVQDLHGYDSPWPAGGNINKLPPPEDQTKTDNGITVSVKDGVYTVTGTTTARAVCIFQLTEAVNLSPSTNKFAFLNTQSNGDVSVYFRRNNNDIHYWTMSPVNRVASSWTDSGNEVVDSISIVVQSGITVNMTISPMLIALSVSDPTTFSPYSNICPISGWTGAKIGVQSANKIPVLVEHVQSGRGDPSPTNVRPISGWEMPQAGTVYGGTLDVTTGKLTVDKAMVDMGTLTWNKNSGERQFYARIAGKANGEFNVLSSQYPTATKSGVSNMPDPSIKGNQANAYVNVVDSRYGNDVTAFIAAMSGVQLCYELAAPIVYDLTPTEAKTALQTLGYDGAQYVIEFPDETGTVYGGTLDVTSGVLTVDKGFIKLTGGMSWNYSEVTRRVFVLIDNASKAVATYMEQFPGVCNYFKSHQSGELMDGEIGYVNQTTPGVAIKYAPLTSVAAAQEFFNSHDVQCVYPLAIPITYQLTPTEVKTLLGVNNIHADTGDTEVTYRADPTIIYNKLTAAIISSGGTA